LGIGSSFFPFFPSRSDVMLPLTRFLPVPSHGASGFFADSEYPFWDEYHFWDDNFCILGEDCFFFAGLGGVCSLWGGVLGGICSLWHGGLGSLSDIGEGRSLSGDSRGSWSDDWFWFKFYVAFLPHHKASDVNS
jgi:hypothetical protein